MTDWADEKAREILNPFFDQDSGKFLNKGAWLGEDISKALRDAVAAERERCAQTPWQPIETAPRDCTAVLLYVRARDDLNGQLVAFWGDESDDKPDGVVNWWFENEADSNPIWDAPTHWKPLGPPPEGEDKEGNDCDHGWADIRNLVIQDGEMCMKCGAVRPGNIATPTEGEGG